jgi:hypothetical protein
MSTPTDEFHNNLSLSEQEIIGSVNKLHRIKEFINNTVTDDSTATTIVSGLNNLITGKDLDNNKNGKVGDTHRLVYKNIAVSIIQICYGMSITSSGLSSFQNIKRRTWPEDDLRQKFLAHLLKAFHHVQHGIIWDNINDEVHENNTQPKSFFSEDAKKLYGKDFKGTTGWSVDDLVDTERLERPLLMQLFGAADAEKFRDLLPELDDKFPILGVILSWVEGFMKGLHETLKLVDGTNPLLNEVGGKALHMYSTTDIIPEGVPTIPPYWQWCRKIVNSYPGKWTNVSTIF